MLQSKKFTINEEVKSIAKVRLFDKPSQDSSNFTRIEKNVKLRVLDVKIPDEDSKQFCDANEVRFEGYSNKKLTWYKVEDDKGSSGYTTGDYLERTEVSKDVTKVQRDVVAHNAKNCLNQVTRDMVKNNFVDFNWGTYNNNCANFVSYILRTAGILNENIGTCTNLIKRLKSLGWREIKVSDAINNNVQLKPGDVWFSEDKGHTEIVLGIEDNNEKRVLKVLGSNNSGNGDVQVVTEVPKTNGTVWTQPPDK